MLKRESITSIISLSSWIWLALRFAYSALLSASLDATSRPNCLMSFLCRSASYPETNIGEDLPESQGGCSFSLIYQEKTKGTDKFMACYSSQFFSLFFFFNKTRSLLLEKVIWFSQKEKRSYMRVIFARALHGNVSPTMSLQSHFKERELFHILISYLKTWLVIFPMSLPYIFVSLTWLI